MEVISKDGKVVITKWYDNKCVLFASNFVVMGIEDKENCQSKQDKKYIDVTFGSSETTIPPWVELTSLIL